ncbi:hypothetical protein MRX96_007185 [Rhipicephalus microplus]
MAASTSRPPRQRYGPDSMEVPQASDPASPPGTFTPYTDWVLKGIAQHQAVLAPTAFSPLDTEESVTNFGPQSLLNLSVERLLNTRGTCGTLATLLNSTKTAVLM